MSKKAYTKGFLRALLGNLKKSQHAATLPAATHAVPKLPRGFAGGVHGVDPHKAYKGYRSEAIRGGGGHDSLVAFLPQMLAEKALGPKKVRKALWKHVGSPALTADTAVGRVLEKTPLVGKKLFRTKEKVPWGKHMFREVERSSALAPLTKLRDIGEPIIVGVGLEKGLHKVMGKKPEGNDDGSMDQALRQKVASAMLHLQSENKGHTKRAHALRLLYKQAEMGLAQVPQSYSELEEKLASLVTQDLVVVEKALELAGGQLKLGELGNSDPKSLNPVEQFQAAIIGDDFT